MNCPCEDCTNCGHINGSSLFFSFSSLLLCYSLLLIWILGVGLVLAVIATNLKQQNKPLPWSIKTSTERFLLYFRKHFTDEIQFEAKSCHGIPSSCSLQPNNSMSLFLFPLFLTPCCRFFFPCCFTPIYASSIVDAAARSVKRIHFSSGSPGRIAARQQKCELIFADLFPPFFNRWHGASCPVWKNGKLSLLKHGRMGEKKREKYTPILPDI